MRSCKFSDPEHEVDLVLSRAGVPADLDPPKDIDDFTNCPTHKSNLGVGWNRCRVPQEMSGHGKGRVESIPKADKGMASVYHRYYSRCLENSYNRSSVSRLLTTVSKITRDVRLKFRLGIGQ